MIFIYLLHKIITNVLIGYYLQNNYSELLESNQWPHDLWILTTTVVRSTNWAKFGSRPLPLVSHFIYKNFFNTFQIKNIYICFLFVFVYYLKSNIVIIITHIFLLLFDGFNVIIDFNRTLFTTLFRFIHLQLLVNLVTIKVFLYFLII